MTNLTVCDDWCDRSHTEHEHHNTNMEPTPERMAEWAGEARHLASLAYLPRSVEARRILALIRALNGGRELW